MRNAINDLVSEVFSNIYEYGETHIDPFKHHLRVAYYSQDWWAQIEEEYDLCTECACKETLASLLRQGGIECEKYETSYMRGDYAFSILIEQEPTAMAEFCPYDVCYHSVFMVV